MGQDAVEMRKISSLCWESKPRPSTRRPVAIPTSLDQNRYIFTCGKYKNNKDYGVLGCQCSDGWLQMVSQKPAPLSSEQPNLYEDILRKESRPVRCDGV